LLRKRKTSSEPRGLNTRSERGKDGRSLRQRKLLEPDEETRQKSEPKLRFKDSKTKKPKE